MKMLFFNILATLGITLAAHSETTFSPDGKFGIKMEKQAVEIVDSSDQAVLVLDKDVTGIRQLSIAWSADSSRVVIAEDFDKGSGIFAAWKDGSAWLKSVQMDSDAAPMIKAVTHQVGGHLVSESRTLGPWISDTKIHVDGQMTFSTAKRFKYSYTLQFLPLLNQPMDRGGYLENVIKGTNYR
jgi:hypothetical protein